MKRKGIYMNKRKKYYIALVMAALFSCLFFVSPHAKTVNLNANKFKVSCGYIRLEDPDTATYLRPTKWNVKQIKIPDKVTLNGYPIRIIAVKKTAFAKAKKLKKVYVGKNLFLIPKGTFKKAPRKLKIYTDSIYGVRTIRNSGIRKGQVIIWR